MHFKVLLVDPTRGGSRKRGRGGGGGGGGGGFGPYSPPPGSAPANPSVDDLYVDGISLTHGAAGSRQHIWTFAAALYETDPNLHPGYVCPCTNTDVDWPYQIPSFIGDNYFCDTANPGPGFTGHVVYQDDPLWDGEGCGPTSTIQPSLVLHNTATTYYR